MYNRKYFLFSYYDLSLFVNDIAGREIGENNDKAWQREEAAPKNVILHLTYILKDSKQGQGN